MTRPASLAFALSALAIAPALVCAQAQAPQSGEAAHPGGEVMFVSGKAERIAKDGARSAVAKGMTVAEGDRIVTDAESHVYVRLRDGGLLVVRPTSELRVDVWRYDAAKPQDSQIKYTLESGVARHVSGQGAKAAREKFRFNTPMAAIGVRGTDFTVLAATGVTRVSVQSGGVIVNSFGDGCRADGLGPCEGASAVELFASAAHKLAQVRAGERRPELIDDPSAAPDRSHPPASGEPVAQKPLASPDVRIADSRGGEVADQPIPVAPPPPAEPPAAAPPPVTPVTPAPPPPPDPPLAVWGRWAAIADKDPNTVNIAEITQGRDLVALNRYYVLASNPQMTSFALPKDGVGSFTLAGHDGVITDSTTGAVVASTASNGKLSIDFGTRRFSTSLNVSAGALATVVSASGAVDANGRFQTDAFTGQAIVNGVVGGKQASEAMYLYERSFDHYTAYGATSWRK